MNRQRFLGSSLALIFLSLGLHSAVYAQVTETQVIEAANAVRSKPQKCPDGKTYPAAPALRVNPTLTAVAKAIADDGNIKVSQELAKHNYLIFSAAQLYGKPFEPATDAAALINYWLTEPDNWTSGSCRRLMKSVSEAGVAVQGREIMVLAEPFDNTRIPEYTARMFAELNRVRATGINTTLYPYAKCTMAPVAPIKWNDKVAEAAQFHSNDMAVNGISVGPDGSPHTGSAGDTPGDRLKNVGCSNGGENVLLHSGDNPEQAIHGWMEVSQGHCNHLITNAATAGFGIAQTIKYQTQQGGPFATYNYSGAQGCETFTRDAPGAGPADTPTYTKVSAGTVLNANGTIHSPSKKYRLIYQGDGNLVLYDNNNAPLWASNTYGTTPGQAIMQNDGNLVVYDNTSTPRWASNTHGNPGAWLGVKDDGTLAIYKDDTTVIWTSNL